MRKVARYLMERVPLLGAVIRQMRKAMAQYRFRKEFEDFKNNSPSNRFLIRWEDRRACLNDRTEVTGFDRHYVYHPAWAARIIKQLNPEAHIDIGSSLFFISVISAFVPVRFYDYRPPDLYLDGLECGAADLTKLPFEDRSIDSLSCMHVVEHVGLGRYGDPLDPDGDIKAMKELQRVVSPGGSLLFVVPVGGTAKVVFNAHRVYSHDQIVEQFDELMLKAFSLIPQMGPQGLVDGEEASHQAVIEEYGCGCFWFTRPPGNEYSTG